MHHQCTVCCILHFCLFLCLLHRYFSVVGFICSDLLLDIRSIKPPPLMALLQQSSESEVEAERMTERKSNGISRTVSGYAVFTYGPISILLFVLLRLLLFLPVRLLRFSSSSSSFPPPFLFLYFFSPRPSFRRFSAAVSFLLLAFFFVRRLFPACAAYTLE